MCRQERESIHHGVVADDSFALIGARLGRSASVICREVARNRVMVAGRAIGCGGLRSGPMRAGRGRRCAGWRPIGACMMR